MNDNSGFSKTLTLGSLIIIAMTFGLIEFPAGQSTLSLFGTNRYICVPNPGYIFAALVVVTFFMLMVRFQYASKNILRSYHAEYKSLLFFKRLVDEQKEKLLAQHFQKRVELKDPAYKDYLDEVEPSIWKVKEGEEVRYLLGRILRLTGTKQEKVEAADIELALDSETHNELRNASFFSNAVLPVILMEGVPYALGWISILCLAYLAYTSWGVEIVCG